MKPLEIKGARTRLGYSQKHMADILGISVPSYRKKESGALKNGFSDEEKLVVARELDFDYDKFNDAFYDGRLPYICSSPETKAV